MALICVLMWQAAGFSQVRDVYPEADKLCSESRWAEAVSLCLEGLAQEGLEASAAVELHSVLGVSYARLGAFGKAAEYMKKCYEYDLANGDKKGLTSSLINLASMYVYAGEPEKGEAYALEAVTNELSLGRPEYLAKAYGKVSDVYHALGRDSTALKYADLALQTAERNLDEIQVAVRRSQRAYALVGLGRHNEALADLQAAEQTLRAAGATQSLSVVCFQKAQLYGDLDDISNEIACLEEAQALASEIRDIPLIQKISKYEIDRREQTVNLLNESLDRERHISRTLMVTIVLLLAAVAAAVIAATRARRAARRLAARTAQKDFLLRVISHDLKSPAVAQLTGIQMLRRNIDKLSPDDFSQVVSQMELNAGAEVELIENALRWSSLQSTDKQSEAVRFNLLDLAHETASQYRQPADIKRVNLSVDTSPDVFVNSERGSIALVLRNLLSNAIKFSSEGDSVTIHVDQTESAAEISVADTGIGIPPEDLDNIFDPARNCRRTGTAGEPSNGLGLSVSLAIVEHLGGTINASSRVGEGSMFTISIPKQ